MATYKLIYFEGCPNATTAKEALVAANLAYDEIIQNRLGTENTFKLYASPTILNGKKIVYGQRLDSPGGGCSVEPISKETLVRELAQMTNSSSKGWVAQLGAFSSALIVGLCPVCLPAMGAFLSSIGLGFLVSDSILRPILWVFLGLAVFGFIWSYLKEHGDWRPMMLGLITGFFLYIGRYVYFNGIVNMILMYGGIVGLIGASLWNFVLRKNNKSCCEGRRKS